MDGRTFQFPTELRSARSSATPAQMSNRAKETFSTSAASSTLNPPMKRLALTQVKLSSNSSTRHQSHHIRSLLVADIRSFVQCNVNYVFTSFI